MDSQKKRNSAKKQKATKQDTSLQVPLAPLYSEINQLKQEVAALKSSKNLRKTTKYQEGGLQKLNSTSQTIKSPKCEKSNLKTIESQARKIREIYFPIKDSRNRINQQADRLYSILKQKDDPSSIQALQRLINCLNICIRDLHPHSSHSPLPHSQSQQVHTIQKLNNQLSKQNINLKHHLANKINELDMMGYDNQKIVEQYETLMQEFVVLGNQFQQVRIVCEELREDRRQLEEKIRVYETAIEGKQADLIAWQEEANFAHNEAQKYKIQKRESDRMLQILEKQVKELKQKSPPPNKSQTLQQIKDMIKLHHKIPQ